MNDADRSREAFAERFPAVMKALATEPSSSTIVLDGRRPVDIVAGEQHIYGSDAQRFTSGQVDTFLEKPLRLLMEAPEAAGLVSNICIDLKLAIERVLREAGASEISRGPIAAPTFLVIFGVGLGYHIGELIERTGARWVIIVEPFVEFIGHSFQAIDWREIFAEVDGRDGAIDFVTLLDPGRIVSAIMHHIAQRGTPYLDGTWVFTHYPVWAFAEAGKRLHGAADFAYTNRGFFEDEIVMMTNAVTNLASHPCWLLDARQRLHRPEIAVVVGAGPSLDDAIETLHAIRDRVVLFSGGTALRPLLRHGLLPDFHCELENGPQVFEVISETGKHGDLKQVRLIASATVDPRVSPMFGETVFFFRDSVSSTRILQNDGTHLNGVAPTCINTAMAAGTMLGFTDFILFGTDCGLRPGMPDHAEGTVYRDIDKWQQYLAKRASYPLEVEGNFGGIAMTNWVYDASRRMLVDLIATYRLNVINCSDGALINGATPRVPESLHLDSPVIDHRRVLDDLKRSMTHFAPGEILQGKDLDKLRETCRAMYADLRRSVAAFDGAAADFTAAFQAMNDFVQGAHAHYGQAFSIPEGSLIALPRIGMFYGCRIADDGLRRRLFATFRERVMAAFDTMERTTDELLARLAKIAPALREPVAG